jgi:putative copper resistance protein D
MGAWQLDPLVLVGLLVTGGLYLWAATRLRRRGDAWPVGRDIAFLGGGLGVVALALLWWPGVYDDTLFWAHMVQHMALSMVAPIFLALGAPVTLLLRTLPAGPRRGLTRALRSLPAKVLVNPLVGFALLFGTPFVLYFTGLYEATLRNAALHALLHVHFLIAGCVFFWPLLGVDPVPGRLPHPMRMLLLFVTLPAHAWLGITIMSSSTVIAGDYYLELARPWGPSLLHDQDIGGGLLWVAGDLIGLLVVAAMFVQWSRADTREATRLDRTFDRGAEDDAWASYNARLTALAQRDGD